MSTILNKRSVMSEASISDRPGGAKRPRMYSVSPNKRIDQLQKLPGGACAKCKQDLGPDRQFNVIYVIIGSMPSVKG